MQKQFSPTSKMNDLIREDASLLLTLTRFELPLGFGEKTVREVCMENQVDTNTFISVINFILSGKLDDKVNFSDISLGALIKYLKNAHYFFIDFKLPIIRDKLIEAIETAVKEAPYKNMILKFYDEYVVEVKKHMNHENEEVFPYVLKLVDGIKDERYSIAIFEKNHENIDSKLTDLRNILIKYFPAQQPNYLLNEVLFDLSTCEKDLERHTQVEDHFFVPMTEQLERSLGSKIAVDNTTERNDNLTDREKEILTCLVKGYTNKEIAQCLFVSTHTVISHRRNIARKLEIHSTAGLTIYAIVNQLVSLEDIKAVIE